MKTFLVTVEDSPQTKWLFSDAMIADTIQHCAAAACNSDTTGPQPKVTCRLVPAAVNAIAGVTA